MSPDETANSPLRHQPADEGRNCRNSDPALALTPLAEGSECHQITTVTDRPPTKLRAEHQTKNSWRMASTSTQQHI